ncbi:ubiquitin-protein transferase activating protein [Physocladia obscura]|uniref:Ubiquitin-protein transferase activating protein n=1 Tax=Physocladia obscura TaxID=109957 RepID=A0AAD5TAQ2_9FUNG|nr:ubiquitin-protein transferase activating protein [Physocladia obscura]
MHSAVSLPRTPIRNATKHAAIFTPPINASPNSITPKQALLGSLSSLSMNNNNNFVSTINNVTPRKQVPPLTLAALSLALSTAKSAASSPLKPHPPIRIATAATSAKKKQQQQKIRENLRDLRSDYSPSKSSSDIGFRAKVMKSSSYAFQYDRYIPNRGSTDMVSSHFHLSATLEDKLSSETASRTSIIPKTLPPPLTASQLAYQEEIAKACGVSLTARILAFKPPAPVSKNPFHQTSSFVKKNNTGACHTAQRRRRIQTQPERVLDSPGILDDYYLNLIDWDNNLAVALEGTVYVWNGDTGNVTEFCRANENDDEMGPSATICSVQWAADGEYLAVGIGNGDTQIWDLETQTKVRTMSGHSSRVGVLSWDRHIVSSGCRDGSIWHHDVRVSNHKVGELMGHTQEVCGLKWRADGGLLASGGNDNLVNIWDARSSVPRSTKTIHNAAVKAIAWCPWQLNLLATGGGTADRQIHFWNTASSSAAPLNSIDTGSQVTSLIWSKTYKEIISSHGHPDNQLTIWGYPNCGKIIDLEGHDARILHAALSPDGSTVVSSSSDENLKFWKAFERPVAAAGSGSAKCLGAGGIKLGGEKGVVAGLGGNTGNGCIDEELATATKRMAIR